MKNKPQYQASLDRKQKDPLKFVHNTIAYFRQSHYTITYTATTALVNSKLDFEIYFWHFCTFISLCTEGLLIQCKALLKDKYFKVHSE